MTLDPSRVAAFYRFLVARESVRLRRAAGLPREEWTRDPILMAYSFTNVKRHHDRTTALLKRELYDVNRINPLNRDEAKVLLLNCAIFRYFGTIEMARALGWTPTWNDEQSKRVRDRAEIRLMEGQTVFTSAYLVPNCGSTLPKHEVVAQIFGLVWGHADHVLDTQSWEVMCERLCQCWGVGSFMAKEIMLDYILATEWTPDDWTTWTPCGPGGQRGAGRVRDGMLNKIRESEALEVIRELYAARHEHWPETIHFQEKWTHASPNCDNHCGCGDGMSHHVKSVSLDLTDIQFQLCEFDKYSRVAEGRRPKRNFRPTIDDVTKG